jgi:hypothetical protein
LRKRDVIVLKADDAMLEGRMLRECDPLLDHALAFLVGGMHLAGDHDLGRSLLIV